MQNSPRFSIVIPVSLRQRRLSLVRRVRALVASPAFSGAEVVVACEQRSGRVEAALLASIERAAHAANARVVSVPGSSERVPLAMIRNRGASQAAGQYVLFFDADLLPPAGFLDRLLTLLERSRDGFVIVPCLYATRQGVRRLAGHSGVFEAERALCAYHDLRRDWLAFLALNTSTVAVERAKLDALGGFDEHYEDHGLEDFDLLLRMALRYSDVVVPSDLLADVSSQAPASARGFRSYLNLLSLPVFFEGLVTLHQWHPRPLHRPYYGNREQNRRIFEHNVLAALRATEASRPRRFSHLLRDDGTLDAARSVRELIEASACSISNPAALHDDRPQFLFQEDRTWRKVRKVLRQALRRRV